MKIKNGIVEMEPGEVADLSQKGVEPMKTKVTKKKKTTKQKSKK